MEKKRMQLYHKMTIAGLDRSLPICPLNEKLSIAGFVIFGDPDLTVACAEQLLEKVKDIEFDYLFAPEAKAIPLIHEMARQSGRKEYLLARKNPKLYMTGVFKHTVRSITTAKEQTLYLDTADVEKMKGKKILLIDDVISTGASLEALESLVEKAGGSVAGKCAILAEGDAQNRSDIIYLEKLPLFNSKGEIIA